jgi:hypothetical protein
MASERPHSVEERPELSLHESDPINISEDSASEEDDEITLQRTQTTASVRERRFEEIRSGDREELTKIATNLVRTNTGRYSSGTTDLERKDTLYGVSQGDAVLDPLSDQFDVYKWARM